MSTDTVARPGADVADAGAGKKKKLVVIVAVVALLAVAGAAYFFLFAPSGDGGDAAEPVKKPGDVVAIDPVSINLADGHYLRLGFSMQMTADAGGGHGGVHQAHALDVAIELYSGRTMEEVNDPTHRAELKEELLHRLEEAYHHTVMGVYFTDYVTQ